jgi:predicted molibdopterin-dependent oxidoreductase YjgC
LEVKDDQILRVTSDDGRGTNKGDLCSKGRFGFHYVDHPERIKTPRIRKGEDLIEATWDEALKTVAERLQAVKEASGGGAIAGLCSARLTNEEAYLFQKLMRSCLETNHIDHSGGYGYSGLEVLQESLGYAATTNSIEDIRDADTVFLLRSDLCETHPVVGYQVNVAVKREGAKLIVAASRDTKMFKFAAHHLILKPGTEVALVNAIIHCILEEGLADSEFVSRHVDGLSSLEKGVAEYTPERASKITGLSGEAVREAARAFARAKKAVVIVSAGLGLPVNNRELASVALDLVLVTGNVGKPGTGLAILGEKCNSQGVLDMGLHPRWLPGYQAVDDAKVREKFEAAWQAKVPTQPGYGARELLEKVQEGHIKALYIVGENPALTYPDSLSVKKALESVDFLVVQDLFLTPTARLADVVLPSASFAEKEGTFTNFERRIQKITTSVSCRGEAKSDMDIFGELAQRWGKPFTATSPDAVMGEISKVAPIYGGIAYDRLCAEGIQWPCPDRSHPGTPRLYTDSFPAGKVRLLPVKYENKVKDSGDEYPFVLLSGASLFHSGSLSLKSSGLTQVYPEARIEISHRDADRLGLREGDLCVVRSRAAEIKGPVKINRYQMEGSVFVPYHFAETPVHEVAATWESFATVNMEKA